MCFINGFFILTVRLKFCYADIVTVIRGSLVDLIKCLLMITLKLVSIVILLLNVMVFIFSIFLFEIAYVYYNMYF